MSLGNQEARRSILASGTFFREDLVMKIFLRPFFLFRWFKKSICQLMAKRCELSTGNLLRGGLPRNSVNRITDRPDMTTAVNRGRKASTHTNKNPPYSPDQDPFDFAIFPSIKKLLKCHMFRLRLLPFLSMIGNGTMIS